MMASPSAGIHETAAQRALQIVEVLEIVLSYTVCPGINSKDRREREKAWEASAMDCRAVNKLWKRAYNGLLLSCFRAKGRVLHAYTTPTSMLRVIAGDQLLAAQVQNYNDDTSHMGYTKTSSWSFAVLASSMNITHLQLNLETLEALSGIHTACPYMQFPRLIYFETGFFSARAQQALPLRQIDAFIERLPLLQGVCLVLEENPDVRDTPPLSWRSYSIARAISGLSKRWLSIDCTGMSKDAATQVMSLIDQARALSQLRLVFDWPLALLSDGIPPSITWLQLECPPAQLPGVLDALTEPSQVPHLTTIPSIEVIEPSKPGEPREAIVTGASISAAVEGLRKRGVKDLEKEAPKLYDVLKPYTISE